MSYNSEVLADSPAFYWRMADADATCVDSGPNAKDGAYNGGYTQGQDSLVYQDDNDSTLFNGSTGYVSLGTNQLQPILSGATALSFDCLFKPNTVSAARSIISLLGNSTNQQLFSCFISATAKARVTMFKGSNGSTLADLTSNTTLTSGRIYHIAAVFDFTSSPNTLSLYIDGVLDISTTDLSGETAITVGTPTAIDRIASNYSNIWFFDGIIDEAALYTSALSPERVLAHHNAARCMYLTFNKPTHRPLRSIQKPIHHIGI
jgi:hypothetical protein